MIRLTLAALLLTCAALAACAAPGCHRPRDKETIVIPIPRDVPPPPHHR